MNVVELIMVTSLMYCLAGAIFESIYRATDPELPGSDGGEFHIEQNPWDPTPRSYVMER